MPRPLLFQNPKEQQKQQQNGRLSTTCAPETKQDQRANPAEMQRVFRKRRSKDYMELMVKLDAGSGHISQKDIDVILQAIHDEFPDIELENELFGCMAVCHLGNPYEVHILDTGSCSITHIPRDYPLASPLDQCRNLSLMPGYLFIEVYSNALRAVSPNGAAANISAPGAGEAWQQLIQAPTQDQSGPCEDFL